jgi:BA14K-like protein
MKAIGTVAIAVLIAAASLTSSVAPADAGGNHWNNNKWNHNNHWKRPYYVNRYYYSNGWNPGAALATGAILGFAFGALATPNYNYAPPAYGYPAPAPAPYPEYYGPANAQHVSWCSRKYRSYNVRYNTWTGYDGLIHQCISPYY